MTWSSLARAQAQPASAELPLDFTWTAPEGCPSRAQVIEELKRAVDAGGKQLPPLWARALIRQDGAAWRLELTTEMDGRRGTRHLEADSCEGLSRAATLVLALTLGEGLARRQQAEAEARATPAPPPPPRMQPPPQAREPTPLGVMLWAAGAVGTDPLGAFGPALALGVAFRPSLPRVGARLQATLPRSSELHGSGGDVQSFSFSAELEACLSPELEPIQLWVCANGGLTLLEANGQGTARDSQVRVPLYGVGPSVGALWLLPRHAFLSLGLVSRFFLARPELVVEGLAERRRIELGSGSAQLGGGVRW